MLTAKYNFHFLKTVFAGLHPPVPKFQNLTRTEETITPANIYIPFRQHSSSPRSTLALRPQSRSVPGRHDHGFAAGLLLAAFVGDFLQDHWTC